MADYKFEYEADWKIFRKNIGRWVERYYQERNEAYIRLLQGEGTAEHKWWKLRGWMKDDLRDLSAGTDMRRSRLIDDITVLAWNGIIRLEDLELFSKKMQENVIYFIYGHVKVNSPGGKLLAAWNKKYGKK